jgi:hypothetical protein
MLRNFKELLKTDWNKMAKIYFYIICVLALLILPLSRAHAGIEERNVFLNQMLSLAEKPKPYFFINMGENKIQLMARGVVLREWVADKIRFTQGYLPLQTLVVEKKSIQLSQLRHAEPIEAEEDTATNITVKNSSDNKTAGNGTVQTSKTESNRFPSLDIADMPTDYQILFNGSASINVVTQAESYRSVMKRYLITPVLSLWPFSKKDNSGKIEIFFKDKINSQTFFWAFTEGTECIILPTGYGDKKDFQY